MNGKSRRLTRSADLFRHVLDVGPLRNGFICRAQVVGHPGPLVMRYRVTEVRPIRGGGGPGAPAIGRIVLFIHLDCSD